MSYLLILPLPCQLAYLAPSHNRSRKDLFAIGVLCFKCSELDFNMVVANLLRNSNMSRSVGTYLCWNSAPILKITVNVYWIFLALVFWHLFVLFACRPIYLGALPSGVKLSLCWLSKFSLLVRQRLGRLWFQNFIKPARFYWQTELPQWEGGRLFEPSAKFFYRNSCNSGTESRKMVFKVGN